MPPKPKTRSNRGKIGKVGRPSKKRLQELFGVHPESANRIRELEKQLAESLANNKVLTAQLAAKRDPPLPGKSRQLLAILRAMKLEVKRPPLRTAFLLHAETREGAEDIMANANALRCSASKIRTARHHRARQADASRVEDRLNGSTLPEASININRYFVRVFGHNVFRYRSEHVLFWANDQLDLAGATVICAFADGRFNDCPRNWEQTFELRLLLQRPCPDFPVDQEQMSVTFGMALVRGKTEDHYLGIFLAAKCAGCPDPPFFLADFELAISRAARRVWPHVRLRGCFFHFLANLRRHTKRMTRWLRQSPSPATINLLTVSPFLEALPYYLDKRVHALGLSGDALFACADFKLIMFVYSTYAVRFAMLFQADLAAMLVRTNNTCEGRNAGIARAFSSRLSLADFLDLTEVRFKQDLVRAWQPLPALTLYDRFLELLQASSTTHSRQVTELLESSEKIRTKAAGRFLSRLEQLVAERPYRIPEARKHEASSRLAQLAAAYRQYRQTRRERKLELQRQLREHMRETGVAPDRKQRAEDLRFLDKSEDLSGAEDSWRLSCTQGPSSDFSMSGESEEEGRDSSGGESSVSDAEAESERGSLRDDTGNGTARGRNRNTGNTASRLGCPNKNDLAGRK